MTIQDGMTENEAIKELKHNIEMPFGSDVSDDASRWAIKALKEIKQYRAIGTVEECREARERQRAQKPIYKHYEDKGESPYIKISCPNGCGIRLYPTTERNLAHEHVFCPKCGQKLDWSDTD